MIVSDAVPWLFTTDMTGILYPFLCSSSRMLWHWDRYGDKITTFSGFILYRFTSIFAKET